MGRNSTSFPKGNGAGKGDGWGGPAAGEGSQETAAPPFEPGNTANTGEEVTNKRLKTLVSRAQRTAAIEERLFELAMTAEREETQVQAGTKLHAIYNGQPVARNVNTTVDDVSQLSDDAIRSELERAGGTSAAADAGVEAPRVPKRPDEVVH